MKMERVGKRDKIDCRKEDSVVGMCIASRIRSPVKFWRYSRVIAKLLTILSHHEYLSIFSTTDAVQTN